jgi:hypothetical protein
MGKVVNFSKRSLTQAVWSVPSRRCLALRDSANLMHALTIVTDTQETFRKFFHEAQTAAVRATLARIVDAMERYAAEIHCLIQHEGDDDPPHCA